MDTSTSEILLSNLSEFMVSRIGLHFPRERWHDLECRINSTSAALGFKDAESCIRWLIASPLTRKQIEILASHFTVGETYFFRDKRSFEVLKEHILPWLISSRKGKEQYLRIWSAGCSTGEEPYSIAILLNKLIPDLKDWNITILATDINPHFLQKASEGVYSDWSFRDTPEWIRRYFRKTKNGFEVLPHIKKMVVFSYHNLAEDTYPSLLNNTNAMDIIFCRNVLMYFSSDRTKQVVLNLYSCLVEGGWLIVSPVETSSVLFSQFVTVNFPDLTIYKKDNSSESHKLEEFIPVRTSCYPQPYDTRIITPLLNDIVPKPSDVVFSEGCRKSEIMGTDVNEQNEQELYKEALALYEKGRYAEVAEKIFKPASCSPDNAKAIVLLARSYANQGKLTEALEWCEKVIAIDRLNPGYHYLCATILQERSMVEEAVKSLKRALYLDQDFVLAHFSLGNLYKQQGKSNESNKYFENALMLLSRFKQDEILPESDGITAGRLSEIITSLISSSKNYGSLWSYQKMEGREELS